MGKEKTEDGEKDVEMIKRRTQSRSDKGEGKKIWKKEIRKGEDEH